MGATAVASIREKPVAFGLPDFANLGVALRIVLGTNAIAAAAALVLADTLMDWPRVFVDLSFRLQPALLAVLALLVVSSRLLRLLSPPAGVAWVVGGVTVLVVALEDVWAFVGLVPGDSAHLARVAALAALTTLTLLAYFRLHAAATRPAVDAARLAALTARIRPHFLFNSLNAVLALIRSEPRRAEEALENLAELFRSLMREPRDLVPLSDEIALTRQYLELERLRLGERLQVEWSIDDMPPDARLPSLMLQPLVENAVYHGIEPAAEGGVIRIQVMRRGAALRIELWNPVVVGAAHAGGNHLALDNIRQRLLLFYDLEARLIAGPDIDGYRVIIELPLTPAGGTAS